MPVALKIGELSTVAWLLDHIDETQLIVAQLPAIEAAMELRPFNEVAVPLVEASIPAQRALANIMGDCPLLMFQAGPNDEKPCGAGDAEFDRLAGVAHGAGINLSQLAKIAALLKECLPFIISMFSKPATT